VYVNVPPFPWRQSGEPETIYAGNTLTFDHEDAAYSVSDWTLNYVAVKQSAGFSFAVLSGAGFAFSASVKASDTVSWVAGTYRWTAYASHNSNGERHEVARGTWQVEPDYATLVAAGYDFRSHVKKVLDAIEAVIEGRATQDQMSYSIGGRSLAKTPIPDLITLRDKYRIGYANELKAERIALGLGHKGRILTRFK
jgi:hypothetical protein